MIENSSKIEHRLGDACEGQCPSLLKSLEVKDITPKGYVNGLTFVFSSSELSHFGRPKVNNVGHLLPKHYR